MDVIFSIISKWLYYLKGVLFYINSYNTTPEAQLSTASLYEEPINI
jgi:hypothetical protein